MAKQGLLRRPGAERTPHPNRVAARIRASVIVLCLVAISYGCAPGLDHRRAAPGATSATTLVMADPVDHLDVLAREPMVVEHPDGTLFVSGFGEPGPKLWKSRDRGATWARVNDGSGVCHAVSLDGGVTWTERPRIHAQGGSSHLAVGPNREVAVRVTPASASGNVFTEGVDLVAVSVDGGTTWRKYPAPGQREWSPPDDTEGVPRWVEPLAWDARGALYSLWTDRKGPWLARSIDQGGTWTT